MHISKKSSTFAPEMRKLFSEYGSEVLFGIILALVVVASTWLSQYIPERMFDYVLTPAMNVATATIGLFGAFVVFARSEGMLARKVWGIALLFWALGDLFYLICYIVAPMHVMNMGAEHLTIFELLFGNMLGWVMTLYPTVTLRPGWLTWKKVLWQVIPLFALVFLDYFSPLNLWYIVALYPYALFMLTISHIRAYRIWCEENFSSMEDIDVQWIIRYCIMFFIIGANYVYMLSGHGHTRAFTQQWFVIFMLAYCTEQIIFRKDPWANLTSDEREAVDSPEELIAPPAGDGELDDAVAANVATLKQWMEQEKPYLNPSFTLIDLQKALPMNRTYLSQLVKTAYGCPFFRVVTNCRIEEAKRLMTENPDIRLTAIAARSGFSSSSVFTRTFIREVGVKPTDWLKNA